MRHCIQRKVRHRLPQNINYKRKFWEYGNKIVEGVRTACDTLRKQVKCNQTVTSLKKKIPF
jgi:hypothetical protein